MTSLELPSASATSSPATSADSEVPQRVTLDDVARRASVSVSTVSRALAGDPQISGATSTRIRELAAELGYVPNIAARTLVKQRSTSLGLVTPDVTDPIHGQVVSGFQQRAAERGYSVVLTNGLLDAPTERRALWELAAHRVGGVALMGCVLATAEIRALVGETPAVMVAPENDANARRRLPTLRPDDGSGMKQVVDHLVRTRVSHALLRHRIVRRDTGRSPRRTRGRVAPRGAGRSPSSVARRDGPRPRSARSSHRSPWTVRTFAVCYDDETTLHLMDSASPGRSAVTGRHRHRRFRRHPGSRRSPTHV